MVDESNSVESITELVDSSNQAEVDIIGKVLSNKKGEGHKDNQIFLEAKSQQKAEVQTIGLGKSISGLDNILLGSNTSTWERIQHKPKSMNVVVPKVEKVGSKRKNKTISNQKETAENKRRHGGDEVLEVSNLLKNEFRSAVAAMQHRRDQ